MNKDNTAKVHFIYNTNPNENPRNNIGAYNDKSVETESVLLQSKVTKKQDFKNELEKFNFDYGFIGAGRGFGNLNISNEIRNGGASRADTKEYREKRESQQLFDFQFAYLDRDYQNPNNIVMPIPRGGESTRKQTQLSCPMRNPNVVHNVPNQDTPKKEFNGKFKY